MKMVKLFIEVFHKDNLLDHLQIADDVKVNGAELKDGLLIIACERILPDHKKKRLIDIK